MPQRISRAVLACVLACSTSLAGEHLVSPTGRADGNGTKEAPLDLATALSGAKGAIKPGDTIRLLGGTYKGAFQSTLKGTKDAPITVRGMAGERVTIDCQPPEGTDRACHFTVLGEWTVFRDFEVMHSGKVRVTKETGSAPKGINRGGVNCLGANIKFINLVVHDTDQGFGFWSNGEGGEIYGCIIYNNGWDAPDRGHGHAIYTQNKTGIKRLVDNIMFNQFSYGIHAYGSSRAFINGFHLEGNVSFNNGAAKGVDERTVNILVGGGSPSESIAVIGNFTYATGQRGTSLMLGYGARNKDAVVKDNYLVGPASFRLWEKLNVAGNVFIAPQTPVRVEPPGGDLAGANTIVTGRPTGVKVFVRPNQYEPGRANAIVYNWDRKDAVEVDLKDSLKSGAKYRIVSAQDFFGQPVVTGTYDGKPVSIPMKDYRAPSPIGKEDYAPPATGPEFNVFLVLPVE